MKFRQWSSTLIPTLIWGCFATLMTVASTSGPDPRHAHRLGVALACAFGLLCLRSTFAGTLRVTRERALVARDMFSTLRVPFDDIAYFDELRGRQGVMGYPRAFLRCRLHDGSARVAKGFNASLRSHSVERAVEALNREFGLASTGCDLPMATGDAVQERGDDAH